MTKRSEPESDMGPLRFATSGLLAGATCATTAFLIFSLGASSHYNDWGVQLGQLALFVLGFALVYMLALAAAQKPTAGIQAPMIRDVVAAGAAFVAMYVLLFIVILVSPPMGTLIDAALSSAALSPFLAIGILIAEALRRTFVRSSTAMLVGAGVLAFLVLLAMFAAIS